MDDAPSPEKIEVQRELHNQAFWLYTILIALAIRQVLSDVIPRFFDQFLGTHLQAAAAGTADSSSLSVGMFYALIFLIMITRFYLGSVLVLAKVKRESSELLAGSGVHAVSGFIHFLLFFVWAYTPFSGASPVGVSLFIWLLVPILLWDVLWYCVSRTDWKLEIKGWVFRNMRTALWIIFSLITVALFQWQRIYGEVCALLYVFAASVQDFIEMFNGRKPPQRFWALF